MAIADAPIAAIPIAGQSTVPQGGPGTPVFSRKAKPRSGARLNTSDPLAKGLVGAWLFAEGGGETAHDGTRDGNDATLFNSPVWGVAPWGSALTLNGTNQYASVSSSLANNQPFAVQARCLINTLLTQFTVIIDSGNFGVGSSGWCIALNNANGIYVAVGNGYLSTTTNTITTGVWYNIVFSFYGPSIPLTFYLNGVSQSGGAGTPSGFTPNGTLRFGRDVRGADPSYFPGVLDSVCVWNRALTTAEMLTVSNDPFRPFRPRRRVLFGSAGGGTTNLVAGTDTGLGTAVSPAVANLATSGLDAGIGTATSPASVVVSVAGTAGGKGVSVTPANVLVVFAGSSTATGLATASAVNNQTITAVGVESGVGTATAPSTVAVSASTASTGSGLAWASSVLKAAVQAVTNAAGQAFTAASILASVAGFAGGGAAQSTPAVTTVSTPGNGTGSGVSSSQLAGTQTVSIGGITGGTSSANTSSVITVVSNGSTTGSGEDTGTVSILAGIQGYSSGADTSSAPSYALIKTTGQSGGQGSITGTTPSAQTISVAGSSGALSNANAGISVLVGVGGASLALATTQAVPAALTTVNGFVGGCGLINAPPLGQITVSVAGYAGGVCPACSHASIIISIKAFASGIGVIGGVPVVPVIGNLEARYTTSCGPGDSAKQRNPNESIGQFASETTWTGGVLGDLFSPVCNRDAVDGRSDYRCLYLYNGGTADLVGLRAYLTQQTPGGNLFIGNDPRPVTSIDSLSPQAVDIGTPFTAPPGVSFSQPIDYPSGLYVGDLPAASYWGSGSGRAIWLRRNPSVTIAANAESCDLTLATAAGPLWTQRVYWSVDPPIPGLEPPSPQRISSFVPTSCPFTRVTADFLSHSGARVTWELDRTLRDPGPYIFQLQYSRSGVPNADDWIDTGPPAFDVPYLVDDGSRLWGMTSDLFYRVLLTTACNTYVSQPANVYGTLRQRDWLNVREILRKERLYQRELVGTNGFLLKAKRYGTQCMCVNQTTGEVLNSSCLVCYGTGIVGGYHTPVPLTFATTSPKSSTEQVSYNENLGTVRPITVTGRVLADIPIVTRDAWISEGGDDRYYINTITEAAAWQAVPIVYTLEMRLCPRSDILYRFPLDRPPDYDAPYQKPVIVNL